MSPYAREIQHLFRIGVICKAADGVRRGYTLTNLDTAGEIIALLDYRLLEPQETLVVAPYIFAVIGELALCVRRYLGFDNIIASWFCHTLHEFVNRHLARHRF